MSAVEQVVKSMKGCWSCKRKPSYSLVFTIVTDLYLWQVARLVVIRDFHHALIVSVRRGSVKDMG